MSETDWTILDDSEASGDVDRGVTAGVGVPNGGTSFAYGFNSLAVVTGGVGLATNQASFSPGSKGSRVSGAMKRHPGGGVTGYSCFLFAGLQGPSINDMGYMLGLSDADPAKIILRKGALVDGFPVETVDPVTNGVLAIGSVSYAQGTWIHLRLDMVVNLNGDVVLNAFVSDLASNPVTAPVFTTIPGMDTLNPGSGRAFLDDTLGVNSGTLPYLDGRIGFGFEVSDVSRRAFFDHIEIARQL